MQHPKPVSFSLCGNLDTGSSASVATRLVPGHWKLIKNKDIPAQLEVDDCGVFMLLHDIPRLRRWWCQLLLENMSPPRMVSCYVPGEDRQRNEGKIEEPARKIQRVESVDGEGGRMDTISIVQMPLIILEDRLLDVVLEEGDKAFLKLSLVCRLFRNIVERESFRLEHIFSGLTV
ncbi:uncharacterized protein LOC118803499 isoform X2 [Colossoma macropomum]|uniref:uncharacterized protein LOC118803499 isoform X2 n=1 Tax=Colossoma macropomum TaxID=42526 RepID=UPI001863D1EF|nr:uncharacterized protein LOC118803499 isoform X2 [Colossoma macropomum]